jgi:hypothetical protein
MMPDGYGNDLPSYAVNLIHSKYGEHPYPHGGTHNAMAAVARLCSVLGIGKKDTLTVLGIKKSNENYWWLADVLGEDTQHD